MTDRLKQIWGDFEGRTSRRLTGRGIDHIIAPPPPRSESGHQDSRHSGSGNFGSDSAMPAVSGERSPAEQAAAALRARIIDQGHRAGKKGRAGRTASAHERQMHHVGGLDIGLTARDDPGAYGTPDEVTDLIRALRATEIRVDRPQADYGDFIRNKRGRELLGVKPRKKFLGIF